MGAIQFAGRERSEGMKKQKKAAIIFSVLLMALISTSAYAQETASGTDEWEFKLTGRFVAAGVDGNTTVSGVTSDVDLSFDDITDDFDTQGFDGSFEAWKGDWGFIFDANYMAMDGDFSFGVIEPSSTFKVDVDIVTKKLEFAVGHRLPTVLLGSAQDISSGKRTPALAFVLIGGGRYAYLKQEIDLSLAGPDIGRASANLGGDEDWVEPFVGGRIELSLTEKLTLMVNGDIGGFGIGTASDRTWNFFAGVEYRFLKWLSGTAGYSIYDIDYERGSGNDRFGLDAQMAGPAIALSLYF